MTFTLSPTSASNRFDVAVEHSAGGRNLVAQKRLLLAKRGPQRIVGHGKILKAVGKELIHFDDLEYGRHSRFSTRWA